jgi:hypothetical protein
MATKVAIEVDIKTGGATDDIASLREELEKVKETQAKLTDQMKTGFDAAGKGAKGASKGMKGFGTSIGGVLKSLGLIAVAMEVFMFLKDLLMKNQKVVDTLAVAFKTIEVLFGKLTDAIEPMGKALMDAFKNPQQAIKDLISGVFNKFITSIKGIGVVAEGVGIQIKGAFTLDWDEVQRGLKQTAQGLVQVATAMDIEQQNAFVNGIVEAGTEALSTASKIEALRKEVKLGEAQQGLLMLQYQREAELQRQIRDNVSLTIEARQEANTALAGILNEQSGEEMKLANKRLELALLEQSINKTSLDAEIEVVNARKGIADINERITGQRSEQLTNENSLKQEGIAISKERISQLEAEAQAEADAAFAISEAKVSAQELLDAYKSERESLSAEQVMQAEIDAALAAEELKFQAAVNAAQELGVFQTEIDELELAQIDERLRIENEIRAKYGDENIRKQEEITNALAKVEADNVKAVKDAEIAKKKLRTDGMDTAGKVLSAIDSLVSASGNQSKEAVALQKTIAIASIAIDTAKSIVAGIAGATTSASATGPGAFVATPIFIATTIATILAAVGSATAILNGAGGGGGSATVPNVSVPSATTAPQIQQVATGTTELGGAEQAQLAPIQAYVVETELTGNQNNVNQIESQANFE